MNPKGSESHTLQSLPGCQVKGSCEALFVETEPHPETRPVSEIALDLQGIPGTRHYGFTRKAGPREPWYKRGMEMRSGRQITAVSREDLAAIAAAMQVERIAPEWIGANIVCQAFRISPCCRPEPASCSPKQRLSLKHRTLPARSPAPPSPGTLRQALHRAA